jgi:Flp pilus assembly protein TadD
VEPGSPALVDEAAVLAVSAEMQGFLDAHVARRADRVARLRQLAYAIVDEGRFGLKYDETTRTASETFRTRRGNCLSFSNLFVAMARRAGLDADFQEVDVPPDWSFKDDTFVLNRHVDVRVDLGKDGEHVVDFNMDDFRTTYDRRRISDARALAHFYNNMGVERMQAGDAASALLYFRRATGHDPLFSPAWTNLGILYLRRGHPDHAEAAYLQALKADGADLVAMSNLASLYEGRGDQERAAHYRSRVTDHRQRNPYYRLQLAREAFLAQDYDGAIRHLNYAIRSKKNEDQFYYLLGLSHLKKGNEQAARRWLSRAEEVAATDALKRRYSSKIDVLLSASPDRDKP